MDPLSQLDSVLQYGALGLLGLVLAGGIAMAYLLVKSALRAFDAHTAGMEKLGDKLEASTLTMLAKVDQTEGRIERDLKDTRHAVRDIVTAASSSSTAAIIESCRDTRAEVIRLRERMSRQMPATGERT
jgi:hypothetical protein